MESLGLPAVTFRDGTTACIQEAVKGEKLIEGQVIEFEDGTTAYIHQVIVQKEPVPSEDAQPVVLEYGSVTYINNTAKESLDPSEAVQLEDGSTAYTHHPVTMPPGSTTLAVKTEAGLEELAGEQEKEDAVKTIDTLEQYPRKDLQEQEVPSNEKEQQLSSRAFQCRYPGCGRFYAAAQHLKVHERAHTGEKPYTCDFPSCGKAFATGCGLRSHSRTHTGEKPYKCPEEMCSKAFRSSGDLHKHIRTHTGERPFKCHFVGCGLSFTTSNILKIHVRRHTGERPYTCSEPGCGRSFSSSTNYKNHTRIHTGEKPYVCAVRACGKRFTEYSSLHKHQVVHSHCKPYPCSSCGKAYKQSSTLAAHRFSSHGELEATQDRQQLLAADTGFPLRSQYIAFLSEVNEEEEKDAMPTQVSFTSQDKTEQVTIVTSGAVMSEESAITALQQQEGALLVTTNGNYIILQLQEQQSLEEAISMTTAAVPPDPVELEAAVSESGC